MTYQVIDTQTKEVKATYSTRRKAIMKADTLDRNYGAVRYIVRSLDAAEVK